MRDDRNDTMTRTNGPNDMSWAEFLAPPAPPPKPEAKPEPPADYGSQVSLRAYERSRRGGV